MVLNRTAEVDRKIERVAALAHAAGLSGIVLGTQHNFAWITAGRSNRVDASREAGVAAILVSVDGRRFVLASSIEAPRMASEALTGLGFTLVEFPWTDERADPSLPFTTAARVVGTGRLGSDLPNAAADLVESRIMKIRSTLDSDELPRYRELGAAAGRVVTSVAQAAVPGSTELDVARLMTTALSALHIRPVVLLVAGDGRIAAYRHPIPTDQPWHNRLLIAVCAEREGQIVAASRLVCTSAQPDLHARTRATASVFGALLEATRHDARGSDLFAAATSAYAREGFPGEERLHHQGGVIGYRAREWVAHPRSEDVVAAPQAFAWNPTITGSKVEETCLLHEDGRLEMVSTTPGWPGIELTVRGQTLSAPDVYVLGPGG